MKVYLKHGLSYSVVYRAWHAMLQRCHNPKCESFVNYGGRGILVCERWKNSFAAFLEDMGHPPDGTSIERRENHRNYEQGNCYWADKKSQQNNTRRNRLITYDGKTLTLAQWAEVIGLTWGALRDRLRNGWEVEKALTFPRQAQFARAKRKPTK